MKLGIIVGLVVAVLALGCESKKEEPLPVPTVAPASAAPPPSPPPAETAAKQTGPDLKAAQDAAELANKIEQTPADAEKILTAAGTSREQFIEKLYVIAEDPLLSAEYARLYQPKRTG